MPKACQDGQRLGTMNRPKRILIAAAVFVVVAGFATYRVLQKKYFTGVRDTPLAEVARAAEFDLAAADGSRVRLSQLLKTGPAVVVFYRGHW